MLEQRLAIVRWAAGLGAITAESLAHRDEISVAAARGRLGAAVARRLLSAEKPLREGSTLYSATPSGLKAIACRLDGCRVGPSNARHLIACAAVAAELERCYPDHVVSGERELRYEEREHGRRLASAVLGTGQMGRPLLHRPDLVIWPRDRASGSLPVVVEVELTLKAQRRLEAICRAWARCRLVAGVLYLAAPEVMRPLARAIDRAHAGSSVLALPLSRMSGPIAQAIPSGA